MTNVFTNLFVTNTPIEKILEHAEILAEINDGFEDLIVKYLNNNNIDKIVEKIDQLESKADDLKFKLRKILNSKIKTIYEINEMSKYLSKQEQIIDLFEDIARKIALNYIDGLDKDVKDLFLSLTKLINNSVSFLLKMIEGIPEVVDSSFSKRLIKKEFNEVTNLENLESQVDKISYKIGKWIYSKKNDLNPVDLIFLKELTLKLVKISDEVENAAELLAAFLK